MLALTLALTEDLLYQITKGPWIVKQKYNRTCRYITPSLHQGWPRTGAHNNSLLTTRKLMPELPTNQIKKTTSSSIRDHLVPTTNYTYIVMSVLWASFLQWPLSVQDDRAYGSRGQNMDGMFAQCALGFHLRNTFIVQLPVRIQHAHKRLSLSVLLTVIWHHRQCSPVIPAFTGFRHLAHFPWQFPSTQWCLRVFWLFTLFT